MRGMGKQGKKEPLAHEEYLEGLNKGQSFCVHCEKRI